MFQKLFAKSEEDGCYNLVAYQSTQVLDILLSDQIYRAHKSITFAREYQALIDILHLDCVCPIFACVKGKPMCADGRVSSSVLLTLRVPKEFVRLTEFDSWADLLYVMKSTKADYTGIGALQARSDVDTRQVKSAVDSLSQQKPLSAYRVPQAVLEEIRPEWLVKYEKLAVKK